MHDEQYNGWMVHNILVQRKFLCNCIKRFIITTFWFLVVVLQQFINENDYVSSFTIDTEVCNYFM